jgi:hypothetical protein
MHTYIKNVVTGLPCVCLSVMIGTDRRPSCLPFRHLPAHACCWQETAVDEFLRTVSVRLSENYGDVSFHERLDLMEGHGRGAAGGRPTS